MNTAARVQAAAQPGQVWADEVTWSAARDAVEFTDAGSYQVKGKAHPLRLWRAVRAVSAAGSRGGAGGGLVVAAPLMGRVRELGSIKELFNATVEDARPRMLLATGGQGLGKSRLVSEFVTYLDGLATTVWWHEGRSESYGAVAFGAWAQMVRQRFGLAEDAAKDQVAAAVADQLPAWVPDDDERAFVATRLGVLLGTTTGGSIEQAELFAGWRLFVERLAVTHPVVLVFEDLHWADDGLLNFLEHLMDRTSRAPIFVVVTAEPQLVENHPDWLAGHRSVTPLPVDPLPEQAMRDLVDALVPNLPAAVVAQLVEYAQGIPLYAVETIRTLIDRGAIEARDAVLCLVEDVTDLDTPASLTGLIAARLDGLPPAQHDLLLGLAVLGTSFPRTAATAITPQAPDQVDESLRALIRKDILTVRDDPLSPDRGQYTFTQNLLRTVAYDLVPRRQRTTWHAAVADHLRTVFPNNGADVIDLIAAHYTDAYATATPAAKEPLGQAAMAAHERAGHRAGSLGAPDTAKTHFHAAAGLAATEPDATRNVAAAARMADQAGRPADALALYERAAAAHLTAGRHRETVVLDLDAGRALNLLGRIDEALHRLQGGLAALDESAEPELLGGFHFAVARAHLMRGETATGSHHANEAVRFLRLSASPEPYRLPAAMALAAWATAAGGDIVTAEAAYLTAIQASRDRDSKLGESFSRGNLAELYFHSDRHAAAVEQAMAALALFRQLGNLANQTIVLGNLALMAYFSGDWSASAEFADQAVELTPDEIRKAFGRLPQVLVAAAQGDAGLSGELVADMAPSADSEDIEDTAALGAARAAVALAGNRPDDALAAAEPAAEAAVEAFGVRCEGFRLAWPLALHAALEAGRLDRAHTLLDLVEQVPAERVPPYLMAQHTRYRGLLAAAERRHGTVESDLQQAIDVLRELGYPYWLAQTRTDLARWLISQQRSTQAQPLLMEAIDSFTRLGARPGIDAATALLTQDTHQGS